MFHLLSILYSDVPFLFSINQLFIISALIVIIFSFFDKISRATKFILTIALIICEVLYFVSYQLYNLDRTNSDIYSLHATFSFILAIMMIVAGLSILLIYLKIMFQATGALKTKAFLIILGILFMIISYGVSGVFLVSEDVSYELVSIY